MPEPLEDLEESSDKSTGMAIENVTKKNLRPDCATLAVSYQMMKLIAF